MVDKIEQMNMKIHELGESLGKSGIMFEEILSQEINLLLHENESIFKEDLASLHKSQKSLDESRIKTKLAREKFYNSCEELINAKKGNNEVEKNEKKENSKEIKMMKEKKELEYRRAYVG